MLFFYRKSSKRTSFISVDEPEIGCWIHAEESSQEDLQQIYALTGLDDTSLNDSLDRYELPRIEQSDNHLIFFARHPLDQDRYLYTTTLTIILTPSYFITISPIKSAFIENLLIKKHVISSLNHSDWMHQVLLRITQEFNVFIRKTRHSIISQEKEMSSVTSEDIYALTKYEEFLNQYLSSLDALTLAVEKLYKTETTSVYLQDRPIVEDILNDLKQSEALSEIIVKNIRSLRDSYQIIFANNLTKTIKLLTSLTIIFTIPNIVASIYGMNIHLPFSGNSNAFSILLLSMFLLSGICGYWFYRKNWL